EREATIGILAYEVERRARLRFLAGELRLRDDAAEAPPARLVLRDQDEVAEVEELQLRAEDRTDARLVRRIPKAHRTVQAVGVGERERVHAALLGCRDEIVDRRRSVEEAVAGVGVQLGITRHPCSPLIG